MPHETIPSTHVELNLLKKARQYFPSFNFDIDAPEGMAKFLKLDTGLGERFGSGNAFYYYTPINKGKKMKMSVFSSVNEPDAGDQIAMYKDRVLIVCPNCGACERDRFMEYGPKPVLDLTYEDEAPCAVEKEA